MTTETGIDPRAIRLMYEAVKKSGKLVDDRMPIQQLTIFLSIASAHLSNGEADARLLGKETGLSQSSVSRNIAALGEWHRLGRPGHGLVEQRVDYEDRRRRPVVLTTKGLKVVKELTKVITKFS
jgi:DNA-binding MarR family transcriptional regulator